MLEKSKQILKIFRPPNAARINQQIKGGEKNFYFVNRSINARKIMKITENIHWLKIAGVQGSYLFQGIVAVECSAGQPQTSQSGTTWLHGHPPKWVGENSHINGGTLCLISQPDLHHNS